MIQYAGSTTLKTPLPPLHHSSFCKTCSYEYVCLGQSLGTGTSEKLSPISRARVLSPMLYVGVFAALRAFVVAIQLYSLQKTLTKTHGLHCSCPRNETKSRFYGKWLSKPLPMIKNGEEMLRVAFRQEHLLYITCSAAFRQENTTQLSAESAPPHPAPTAPIRSIGHQNIPGPSRGVLAGGPG